MRTDTPSVSQITWHPVSNSSGETIPAFAAMEITGLDTDTGEFTVDIPSADNATANILFNGPVEIEADESGAGTYDMPASARYNTSDGTPGNGADWGVAANDWKLREGYSGFLIQGVIDSTNGVAVVIRAAPISGARVYLPSAQTISNDTIETLTGFDSASIPGMSEDVSIYAYDDGGYFDAGNSERLTIPEDGIYLIGCEVHWEEGTTGHRQVEIFDPHESAYLAINNMAVAPSTGILDFYQAQSVSTVIKAVAGAYFYVRVYHNDGGDLDVMGKFVGSGPRTVFWIHKLSGSGGGGGSIGGGTMSNQDSDDVTLDGQLTVNGSTSPAQITGNVNDYDPTGWN